MRFFAGAAVVLVVGGGTPFLANAARISFSRNDGSVSHTSIVSYSLRPHR